jgi:hypothetical protein
MTPKALLRHPDCKSPLAEFDEVPDDKGIIGVRFKRLIMDESATDRCDSYPFVALLFLMLPTSMCITYVHQREDHHHNVEHPLCNVLLLGLRRIKAQVCTI